LEKYEVIFVGVRSITDRLGYLDTVTKEALVVETKEFKVV
jgi:hypothetical protein